MPNCAITIQRDAISEDDFYMLVFKTTKTGTNC